MASMTLCSRDDDIKHHRDSEPRQDHLWHRVRDVQTGCRSPPNSDTVSMDKQRARFVRDRVQRDRAHGLNHRHVWGMYRDGKITDRAYRMILRRQKIENSWPTSSRPKDAENNARTVDLARLHEERVLSDVAYDSVLESQDDFA